MYGEGGAGLALGGGMGNPTVAAAVAGVRKCVKAAKSQAAGRIWSLRWGRDIVVWCWDWGAGGGS